VKAGMNHKQAAQIADLINARNELARRYAAKDIQLVRENYLFELSKAGNVIGCVEVKRVQWYQFEIDHLSIAEDVEGNGVAWALFKRVEQYAVQSRGRLIQCTIREGNEKSQRLFKRNGFSQVSVFHYPDTGNNVGVWQKVISPKREVAR
jgi:ribosomal protein S18 acetylase RimI-like enzyme